jgi:hypothetical protein
MPFTVAQLRTEMSNAMVASQLLSQLQLNTLMTAQNIDQAVNALAAQIPNRWYQYWLDLSFWIGNQNGDITQPTASANFGLVLPPEFVPRFPATDNKGLVILLNDCFDDTWRWMQQPNRFSTVQALVNHMRLLRI